MSDANSLSKRKALELAVPERGEDPAERKRVLNVLAQRRYRQRRKAHLKKLEAQAEGPEAATASPEHSQSPEQPSYEAPNSDSSQSAQQFVLLPQNAPSFPAGSSSRSDQYFTQQIHQGAGADPQQFTGNAARGQSQFSPNEPFAMLDPSVIQAFPEDSDCVWDTSVLLPSLASTPLSETTHSSSSSDGANWSLTSVDFAEPSNQQLKKSAAMTTSYQSPPPQFYQQHEQYSFPDDAYLEVSELNLLRACVAIAKRLSVAELMWSLTATSPFTEPNMALASFKHLPVNLQPTAVQMTVPHHPVMDLLPWPSVRNRLILVFSQPADIRPPSAASPTALIDLVYDIEDSAEGVRVRGDDPYSAQNWEVGQKVFKNWWWAFDRDVIARSNVLRENRGAPALGHVLGEVA